jgi:hypothetical protein
VRDHEDNVLSSAWDIIKHCQMMVRCWCRSPTSWEPQEKVWWAQQQVFPQLWNQGLSNQ